MLRVSKTMARGELVGKSFVYMGLKFFEQLRPETRIATSRVSGRKETKVSLLVSRKAKK